MTNSAIGIGQAIAEYLGEVSCQHKTTAHQNSTYSMKYPLPNIAGWIWTIDALHKGNVARFINHSREPNVKVQVFFDGSLLRLAIVANRHICSGEELTLDYGPGYWLSRNQA